jgi:hypothetical protein
MFPALKREDPGHAEAPVAKLQASREHSGTSRGVCSNEKVSWIVRIRSTDDPGVI